MTGRELLKLTNEMFAEIVEGMSDEAIREVHNRIIELNMRLVPYMLKKFKPYSEDKYQDGCIGLIKAVHAYNPDRGVPFPNLACLCIEREIQIVHKKDQRTFEAKMGSDLLSANAMMRDGDGKEGEVEYEDYRAQEAFDRLIMDAGLEALYEKVINPSIEAYSKASEKIDSKRWAQLELQYILAMAEVRSQRQRLTFTSMAEELGTTTQNMRTRHKRLMDMIREKAIAHGFEC